jgi:dienelactone hydrolase
VACPHWDSKIGLAFSPHLRYLYVIAKCNGHITADLAKLGPEKHAAAEYIVQTTQEMDDPTMSKTLWQYYTDLGAHMADSAFDGIHDADEWAGLRVQRKDEFLKSMGLHPLPERCEPNITNYGEFTGEGYRVRKIAYQILPDCWATANLYLPDPLPEDACPGVLYCCGHYRIGIHGYQDHAAMWARRGYACLIFDTIEQHDNPGEHHGLYTFNRFDWLSLGYSAASGELWNSLRALDVLCSLPEVDADRIAATGISGGGAHSLYVTAADERIKAVATSCGAASVPQTIANLNMLGHCDCMYLHNWWQRDLSEFAGLIAPRPLLYCFASEDPLFTKAEYTGLYERTRSIYDLHACAENCELCEYPGPHAYSLDSVQRINSWFDKHVAGQPMPEDIRKESEHSEQTVTVFDGLSPQPNRLDILPELLNPVGSYALPKDEADWPDMREETVALLRSEVFHWLDDSDETLEVEQVGDWLNEGLTYRRYRCTIAGMEAWMQIILPAKPSERVIVGVANTDENVMQLSGQLGAVAGGNIYISIVPRGCGFTANHPSQDVHHLRAAALVGLTPALLMMHDTRLMLDWLVDQPDLAGKPITLFGRATAAVAAAYTAILDNSISGIILQDLPATHRHGGYLPRILRFTDLVPALGLLAPRPLTLVGESPLPTMTWPPRAYERLGCEDKCKRESALSQDVIANGS